MMMASERNKPSVIAKLMGLEDVPSQQQPAYRQHRVLSDYYLQKSASIGSYKKRSSKLKRRSQMINKENSTIVDGQTSGIEERNLRNVKQVSKPLFSLASYTTSGWEFKKQLLERSKRTKVCQDNWFCKRWGCKLDETPSMPDLELNKRSKMGTEVIVRARGNEGWKDKSITKLPIFKRSNLSSNSSSKYKKMLKADLISSSGRHDISKDVDYTCSLDVSFKQDSPCEDGFTSINCRNIDNELPRNVGEAYQPSPNSVLEPDNSSGSECGLWMKLQILKSESEENQFKHETVTLRDEDATERSFSISQNTEPSRCFGPKEGQQFSYLVKVLNELGFHGGNVEVSTERCIVNPLIFETLEKKHGKQKSWNKTDRKLLFDYITFGLTEIVQSKSLRRKMSNFSRRDIVEEELWNMLLSQEKEVNADLSEKAVGKEPWLDLADEVDSIVGEIEAFLFNELATELVVI